MANRIIQNYFLWNLIIVILVGIVIVTVYFRLSDRDKTSFECNHIDRIYIYDENRNTRALSEVLSIADESYVLLLEISSCPSCMLKGFDEVQSLKKEKKDAFAIVIYDWFEEWRSWSGLQDFDPIYMMKKATYHDYLFSSYLPVLVKFKKGRVAKYRYIY